MRALGIAKAIRAIRKRQLSFARVPTVRAKKTVTQGVLCKGSFFLGEYFY